MCLLQCFFIFVDAVVLLYTRRLQTEDVVQQIIQLATALDTTRFADFWSLAAASKDLVASGERRPYFIV